MTAALALAARGLYTTTPNPHVGCVLVNNGVVVGEGWHVRAGEPHAEVVALRAAGERARGATAYVTLEPCHHHGRTPPCDEALIAAGVKRVVAAMQDPDPRTAGQGLARLSAAGIETTCGLRAAEAAELNIGFTSRVTRGRPWVRLKIAASLDGRTALANGQSQWITGAAARRDGHAWRARACAVLTGIGTVKDDDPQLNVREVETTRQPLRVIVDSRLETPPTAKILGGGGALIFCARLDDAKRAALEKRGAEIVVLPNASGKVELPALLQELGRRGINELHVEAGHKLNGSLIREGCVDELLLYLAPCLLGDAAQGMAALGELAALDARQKLMINETRMIDG
ncbi:MAG: bifunctional diaminohydroxyphosphoribosylaminopyrimidine deaminase/5-amino-6-(5-phosphoribosylamino)uracil reductase RibD, partial [Betaproteobacteria bacterium]|nr:bifunctional diaminohydroxyphosphoribosylaminopyrimidine deaminase/5-amino-6-(5-phosphoribosylamino)uracil reductase RibD [Betaproteobacteria bacterium]